jgi:nicotinate phosphoribosyltransferase
MPAMTAAALRTDLYQLTMAAGYFHRGLAGTVATCELFVRRLPRTRRYLVACGIEQALAALADLRFDEEEIAFLRTVPSLAPAMTDDFVRYLRDFRFRGDVWAVPEGTVVFAGEPLLQVRAPLIEAQIVETFLLSQVNHGTMIASKAARVIQAASGRQVLEFGTRRTHPEAAVDVARAAYLAGAIATSNVEAGRRFRIPLMGTAAHMWTMTHDSEEAAFASYLAVFPTSSVLLVDTYDTIRGAERAARIAGERLRGVRLDSGDLGELAKAVRQVLDAHGAPQATIVASGDLDEHKIAALLAARAPIDAFGVGTELACSADAPALGGVYKCVAFERDGRVVPVAKFSEGKATWPGAHQLWRRRAAGVLGGDVLALAGEPPPPGAEPLLVQRLLSGAAVSAPPSLEASRAHAARELAAVPAELRTLDPTTEAVYPVEPSAGLESLLDEVRSKLS